MKKYRQFLVFALLVALLVGICGCTFNYSKEDIYKMAETTPEPTAEPTPSPEAEVTPKPEELVEEVEEEPEPEIVEDDFDGLKLLDEDGDGVIRYDFNYKGAHVYTLTVLDPSRVILGTAVKDPEQRYGAGLTLDVFLEEYDAIGGINAGVFIDADGAGSGWPPYGITYNQGVCYNTEEAGPVVGIDSNNKLFAGYISYEDTIAMEIQNAVSFDPIFVSGGVKTDTSTYEKGIGGRTAIGQRADGSIVLMVADGRQGYSIGLTFVDVADIMYDIFGCVEAANMDGGNSSCIAFEGVQINNSSNQAGGTRNLPTAWLIKNTDAKYKAPDGTAKDLRLNDDLLSDPENRIECDDEMNARLMAFAGPFMDAYYGYFGTKNADMYYPAVKQYVLAGSDLDNRIDQALMDRNWVNTYHTASENRYFNGAYDNGDGTYTIHYISDVTEFSTYWTYAAPGTYLKIIVVEDPNGSGSFKAIATM